MEAVASQGQPEGQPDSSDISEVEDEVIPNSVNVTWGPVTGKNLRSFHFDASCCGVPAEVKADLVDKTPYQFYKFFVTDHIINLMVAETNRYAQQSLENANLSRFSRLQKWKETSAEEMEKFLGIILWMGLNKKPKLSDYWSKKILYENKAKDIMSRNHFELILRMWHLFNNQECPECDRLFKIKPLIHLLLERFQSAILPARDLCIDETMVPFRGKLSFKQYIKNKKHKFGIKLYKLCTNNGYKYNLKVYCGRYAQPGVPVAFSVVMELSKNLLDSGRVLHTDNFCTSMHLAHELLKRGTHLVGTLRSNRKLNPQDVIKARLKVSETVARESNTGAVVLK
nr:unnamed protein product [Callosobruchus chinensis]